MVFVLIPIASPEAPVTNSVAVTIPVEFTEAKVTESLVPTGWPIAILPSVIVTPVPPLNWSLIELVVTPDSANSPVCES